MISRIIILGGHIQALGLARQAKKKGVCVTLIIPDGYSVARFSNCVDSVTICKEENDLHKTLLAKGDKSTLLFPTSDEYIDYILHNYSELREHFTIALPEPETAKLFANKIKTYQFAQANDIPHPQSFFPEDLSDAESIADTLVYPVVIKPAVMYDFHQQFGKKAFLCSDKESLLLRIKHLANAGYPVKGLIIQEFLSGGAKNLFSFGFFSVNGVVKSSIIVNRIRQNPMDFGNSTTFAITKEIPQIEESAKRIIRFSNYTGMGEAEFMYDKGEYKFLEINTRAWKWHSISEGRGFSFLGDWIDWLNNESIAHDNGDEAECAWVERLTDCAVIVKGTIRGKLKLGEAIRSYWHNKISAVWRINDPLPAIMYVLMAPVLFVKRY